MILSRKNKTKLAHTKILTGEESLNVKGTPNHRAVSLNVRNRHKRSDEVSEIMSKQKVGCMLFTGKEETGASTMDYKKYRQV